MKIYIFILILIFAVFTTTASNTKYETAKFDTKEVKIDIKFINILALFMKVRA